MNSTLELALAKAAALPEAMQEVLGRDLLVQIDSATQLRAYIKAGLDELDAGLGVEIDIEELILELRSQAREP